MFFNERLISSWIFESIRLFFLRPTDEDEIGGCDVVNQPKPMGEKQRAKYLAFAENRRPPYWGTWRKKSRSVTPRRPFSQDTVSTFSLQLLKLFPFERFMQNLPIFISFYPSTQKSSATRRGRIFKKNESVVFQMSSVSEKQSKPKIEIRVWESLDSLSLRKRH